jgi:hypothetical protein
MSNDMDEFLKPVGRSRAYRNRFADALSFGEEAVSDIIPFSLKFLSFVVPAVLLGHMIDQIVIVMKNRKIFGNGREALVGYLLVQLLMWLVLFFGIYNLIPSYAREFQGTAAGIFFIALFFAVQTNFVDMLQKTLNLADHLM